MSATWPYGTNDSTRRTKALETSKSATWSLRSLGISCSQDIAGRVFNIGHITSDAPPKASQAMPQLLGSHLDTLARFQRVSSYHCATLASPDIRVAEMS